MEIRFNFARIDNWKKKRKRHGRRIERSFRVEVTLGQQRKSTRFKYSQHGHFHFLALPAWRNIIQ